MLEKATCKRGVVEGEVGWAGWVVLVGLRKLVWKIVGLGERRLQRVSDVGGLVKGVRWGERYDEGLGEGETGREEYVGRVS